MSEHRRNPRIDEHADVAIRIRTAPEAQGLVGKVFPSHSEDVSLSGMRLDVDIPVPIGALLELDVVLHNSPKKFKHLGNVVWANVVDDDNLESGCGYEMGIMFHLVSNPQFDSWISAVSDL